VEDLNSANGTKTNGSDIRGKSRQELKDGDRIEVADVVALTFKA
jgi:pSer/pThr/pTyr-binding forkhead associated (FHA) protein